MQRRVITAIVSVLSLLILVTGAAWYAHTAPPPVNAAQRFLPPCKGNDVLRTTALYDSATDKWSGAGLLHEGRDMATPIVFNNPGSPLYGQVLVAGGVCGHHEHKSAVLSSTELYNPATRAWTEVGSLSVAREDYIIALLPNGQVLIAGGIGFDGRVLSQAELFNPSTRTWRLTSPMWSPRHGTQAALLTSGTFAGEVMVVGGYSYAGLKLSAAELYNPVSGLWHILPPTLGASDGSTTPERVEGATVSLHDGTVMLLRGDDIDAPVAWDELYTPNNGTFGAWTLQQATNVQNQPETPRESFVTAVLSDSEQTVLLAGGFSENLCQSSAYMSHLHVWQAPATMPTCGLLDSSLVALPNGDALLVGGIRSYSPAPNVVPVSLSNQVAIYHVATNTWQVVTPIPAARHGAMAVLLTNGQVLIFGGSTDQ